MSVPKLQLHRLAGATKDWAAIASYQRKPVDLYQQLYSLPEPDKNEFRYIIIGAASAVLWVAIYVIWRAL